MGPAVYYCITQTLLYLLFSSCLQNHNEFLMQIIKVKIMFPGKGNPSGKKSVSVLDAYQTSVRKTLGIQTFSLLILEKYSVFRFCIDTNWSLMFLTSSRYHD